MRQEKGKTKKEMGRKGGCHAFPVAVLLLVLLLGLSWGMPIKNVNQTFASGWQQISYTGSAPAARSYHTTALDDKGRAFLFAGNTGVFSLEIQNDLYVFYIDAARWEKLTPWGKAPVVRYRHSAVFDPTTRNMVVFGGASSTDPFDPPTILGDVNHYNVDKNEWKADVTTSGPKPEPRLYHTAVAQDGVMTIFGGNGPSQFYNNVYKYHIAEQRWEKPVVSGSAPIPRSHASAVLYKDKMVIFGGLRWHGPEGYLNDVHSFDLVTNRWAEINPGGTPPTRRVGHSAAVLFNSMYIFGGYEIEGLFVNDLFALDLDKNVWTQVPEDDDVPRKRFSHTAVVPKTNNFLIFYGFSDELVLPAQNFDDVWKWTL